MQAFNCNMWDLVPGPRIKPKPPALRSQNPSHWSIREVPLASSSFLSSICARKGLRLSSQPRFPLKGWEPNLGDFLLFFLVSFPLLFLSVYTHIYIMFLLCLCLINKSIHLLYQGKCPNGELYCSINSGLYPKEEELQLNLVKFVNTSHVTRKWRQPLADGQQETEFCQLHTPILPQMNSEKTPALTDSLIAVL